MTWQTDASPDLMKAVFLAEAQCVTSAPTA
jgi:hypothetical protein